MVLLNNKSNKYQLQATSAQLSESWFKKISIDWKKYWPLYMMVLPAVLFYLVWLYGPMWGSLIAFQDFSIRHGFLGSPFVGLENFIKFFESPFAFRVVRNTVMINFWNLVFGFTLPIIFALLLNEIRNRYFKRVVQTITYMPYFIAVIVVAGLLVNFTSSDGIFADITVFFGGAPTNLLARPELFRTIFVGSEIWQFMGWNSIIFLAALAAVNTELYEAAIIDGASKLKQIYHVTIPGIMPTIIILLILQVGSIMNLGFEKIILLYNPLTFETGDVISSFVFRRGIENAEFGFSAAVGLFNSAVNFAMVIIANRISAVLTETSLW